MEITFFYIPVANIDEANVLGEKIVRQRIAACANVFPIQSVFPWQGQIEHAHEAVLVLKTIPSLQDAVSKAVEQNHSYELPCILCWTASVNEAYGRWVREQVDF